MKTLTKEQKGNNKLIAEFMGILTTDNWYEGSALHKAGLPFACGAMGNGTNEPPFLTNWNWLMPVVEKIKLVVMEDNTDELYNSEVWDNITHALVEVEIEPLFKSVIKFINDYNKNK